MNVLVTGASGQLGYDVMKELEKRGHTAVGTALHIPTESPSFLPSPGKTMPMYVQMDLQDERLVKTTFTALRPEAVIHCAAWTAVDAAEEPENSAAVYGTNTLATRYIAEACASIDAKLLYISTDYVFDGQGTEPWQPDDKSFAPLNVYGRSKLEGELAAANVVDKLFVVRIAWVFGKNGRNFVNIMLNIGKSHDTVRVVNDQIGTPTYTADLARLLADMIVTEKYGVYHATNEGGYISWYDFAKEIYRQSGLNINVIPVSTEVYGMSRARRPMNSRLDKSKLAENGFQPLPDWKDALFRYLLEIGELR